MPKNNPTPKNPNPEARLHMSMNDFSFFGKNVNSYMRQITSILDAGHTLKLYMTQSTSLSNDLHKLDLMLAPDYEMHIRYRSDSYDQSQVIVILQMEVVE
tara:strand:- start:32 stop:331 length:300 start_codon:yes stop_codon:yes gene_type:complete